MQEEHYVSVNHTSLSFTAYNAQSQEQKKNKTMCEFLSNSTLTSESRL